MEYMREYTISVLNDLIDVCRDEYSLFNTAAKNIEDENLKPVFQKYICEKYEQIIKLESEVKRLGGTLRDTILNVQSPQQDAFNNTPTILRECIKKDYAVINRYSSAIKEDILWEVIPLVAKQYFGSKSMHDQIFSIYKKFNQQVSTKLMSSAIS